MNTLRDPAGDVLNDVYVKIELKNSPGYVTASDQTIESIEEFYASGTWSKTLIANSLINPANTYYEITEKPPAGSQVTHTIQVPNGAGPYFIEDILVTPPTQSTVHESDTTAHNASSIVFTPAGSLASTNVQDAIVEAVTEAAALAHNHSGVYEPAGSTATHAALTTAVHGITDTGQLATLDTAQTFTAAKTFQAAGAATAVAATRVTGDAQDRFHVLADGRMEWGPGNGAIDASLYRVAAGTLKIPNVLSVGAGSGGLGSALDAHLTNAAQLGLIIRGAVSQSANLFETQDSGGTVGVRVDSAQRLGVGMAPGTAKAAIAFPDAATGPGLSMRQGVNTAYGFDWQIEDADGFLELRKVSAGVSTLHTAFDRGSGNIGLGTKSQFGGGAGVLAITNATTVPSINPSGGGVLYAEGGALKYRGSSGTVTQLAAA